MPPISDLVRDSKLETKFYPGYTQHVYYVSGATPRQRKVRKEERWERGRNLGAGAFRDCMVGEVCDRKCRGQTSSSQRDKEDCAKA